jgi:hypothetical protein
MTLDENAPTTGRQYSISAVLAAFGVGTEALLGRGGEAAVYALDGERVSRVLHPGGDVDQLSRTQGLLRDLVASAVSFRIPEIQEIGEIGGRAYAIERRLPGRSLVDVLTRGEKAEKDELIEVYLDAAWALGDLRPDGWACYGELAAREPLRAETWREFLAVRADRSLAIAGHPLDEMDGAGLAVDLPEADRADFVHLARRLRREHAD